MTDEHPTLNVHPDRRMGMLDVGIPLEALTENWPDATPEESLDVLSRINLTAVRQLNAFPELDAARAAIGYAIDNHPKPATRNIALDGQPLRDQVTPRQDGGDQ